MNNLNEYVGKSYDELDCWSLVRRIYKDVYHIALPKLPIETEQKNHWREVPPGSELQGDLLLFRIAELKRHVGLVVGEGRMIHSDETTGVVIEKYTGPLWDHRLKKIYRHE